MCGYDPASDILARRFDDICQHEQAQSDKAPWLSLSHEQLQRLVLDYSTH